MNNRELKDKILNKELSNEPLILVYQDSTFLAMQYVREIAKQKDLEIVYIDKLSDISESIFGDDFSLYVLMADDFQEDPNNLKNNLIVVCKSCSDNLKDKSVELVKVENWQIIDYVKTKLPGLNEQEINWLCDICNYNIYRLENEANKISMFSDKQQDIIFNDINNDNGYSDLNNLTIYNYINYMIKRDRKSVAKILSDLKNIDVEGTGAVTLLLRQFLNIINVQMNPKATPESLGVTPKQFNGIKYSCGYYKNKELIDIYEFLTDVDYKLKSGLLQFSADNRINNSKLVDYITCTVLG